MLPGAHLLAFGGTRTSHRVVCAIEDAGFEIRDTLCWLYGSGFSKGGLLKNRKELEWCECDDPASKRDVRPLRDADVSKAQHPSNQRGQVLFPSLSQQDAPEWWPTWSEPQSGGRQEPSLEGRQLHRAGEGLSDGAHAGSPESAEERVCSRAYRDRREDACPSTGERRGSASPESQPSGQPTPEPESVCQPFGALEGTLSGRGACPRCGKFSKAFEGFSTTLKPAHEPIILARKPLDERTVAANVLAHGTGAINVDACRIGSDVITQHGRTADDFGFSTPEKAGRTWVGRWPANVLHDGSEEVLAAFPDAPGQMAAITGNEPTANGFSGPVKFGGNKNRVAFPSPRGDSGSAARFFQSCNWTDEDSPRRFHYTSKANSADRQGSKHPTVKPTDLMRWLVRLITPPGGTVLDPFCGTGSTLLAADQLGFNATGIEADPTYGEDARRKFVADAGMFADLSA